MKITTKKAECLAHGMTDFRSYTESQYDALNYKVGVTTGWECVTCWNEVQWDDDAWRHQVREVRSRNGHVV